MESNMYIAIDGTGEAFAFTYVPLWDDDDCEFVPNAYLGQDCHVSFGDSNILKKLEPGKCYKLVEYERNAE